MRLLLILCACLTLASWTARAEGPDLLPAVKRTIEEVIRPAFREFEAAAAANADALTTLCAAAEEPALQAARDAFAPLVVRFSRIEPFRFGPLQREDRMERLFFWPDPRGRGLKQVQKALATADATAATLATLQQKSVALQGLPALEFLLFGTNSDRDLTRPDSFRCQFARAIAQGIAEIATQATREWEQPDGITAALLSPSPDAALYRTQADSLQELVKAIRQSLQALSDLKLAAALRDDLSKVKPKRLPFWRSGLALQAMTGTLSVSAEVIQSWRLPTLMARNGALAGQIDFEFDHAVAALNRVDTRLPYPRTGEALIALVSAQEGYSNLSYARFPVNSVIALLSEEIAESLGLTIGFNALDGD